MENMDFTEVIVAVIGLLTAAVTGVCIPLLKTKLDAEKAEKAMRFTELGVKAAEQLLGGGSGAEKRGFVKNYLADCGVQYDDVTVEAAVWQHFGKISETFGTMHRAAPVARPCDEMSEQPIDHEV